MRIHLSIRLLMDLLMYEYLVIYTSLMKIMILLPLILPYDYNYIFLQGGDFCTYSQALEEFPQVLTILAPIPSGSCWAKDS